MFKKDRKMTIFYLIAIVSLMSGGALYVVFRENTYIAQIIRNLISVDSITHYLKRIDNNFLKFYFVDYLWALSLSCGLHIIFSPNKKGSILCTGIISFIGIVYELLQLAGIISGTGDLVDVILYFLAGVTVNILYLKGVDKNEKGT